MIVILFWKQASLMSIDPSSTALGVRRHWSLPQLPTQAVYSLDTSPDLWSPNARVLSFCCLSSSLHCPEQILRRYCCLRRTFSVSIQALTSELPFCRSALMSVPFRKLSSLFGCPEVGDRNNCWAFKHVRFYSPVDDEATFETIYNKTWPIFWK